MADTKYYYDFHFPLKVVEFLWKMLYGDPSHPTLIDAALREWFSQPRDGTDTTTEVIRTSFKAPVTISEIAMEVLRMPCQVEVWYQDRSNNWRQLLDRQRNPIHINVSRSNIKSWHRYRTRCYPVIAKQIQIRMTRVNDSALQDVAYILGLRNTLFRRTVFDRESGRAYFENELDVFGNVISKYVKDWAPVKAADNDAHTYWKSAPQPDPAAVVSLYLDVRNGDGTPNPIDRVYLDPVYTGSQHLNLYYSNDDTVGTLKLNPVTIVPDSDVNTQWRIDKGRWDISSASSDTEEGRGCHYQWTLPMGPLVKQDTWIGISWTPDFTPGSVTLYTNPVLFRDVAPVDPASGPTVSFDVTTNEFVLEFSDAARYATPLLQDWKQGDSLEFVVAWNYDPGAIHFEVRTRLGVVLAVGDWQVSPPESVSIGGLCEIRDFRGLLTCIVVKLESYVGQDELFFSNSSYYVDPDPVISDSQGNIPATTLDNAVFLANWEVHEHPCGGTTDSAYESKEWSPIWRDYIVTKGMIFLPQSVSMKYLKLEFTNLTEESYPVYESGIETRYKSYPVSVTMESSIGPRFYTGAIGFVGLSSFIGVNAARAVNWLDPTSVNRAIGSLFEPAVSPVQITYGDPIISETLPNQGEGYPGNLTRVESSSQFVYRRTVIQTPLLTANAYNKAIGSEGRQSLPPRFDVPWTDIQDSNDANPLKTYSSGVGSMRGADWWVFPGQMLKLPASVMSRLTKTATIVERKFTLERRVRFSTVCVHRYDFKTVTRDSAIAYFAGVREVTPYITTHIDYEDQVSYDFDTYNKDQWEGFESVRQLPEGPITTGGQVFHIANDGFEDGLTDWNIESGVWEADMSHTGGHGDPGSSKAVISDVSDAVLASNLTAVEPLTNITASCWVRWEGLVAAAGASPIALQADAYDEENNFLSSMSFTAYGSGIDWAAGEGEWVKLSGTDTAPDLTKNIRVKLMVTGDATAGSVWFDTVEMDDADYSVGTIYKEITTHSNFVKVEANFEDSGLVRSNSMWADINPDSQSIDDVALAPYVKTYPEVIPGGNWNDFVKDWGGTDVEWGSLLGAVSVNLDGERRYQGKRVLKFHREEGYGEAGLIVRQWLNFVPDGLYRLGCVVFKPYPNQNKIELRLRHRDSPQDVFVYREVFDPPAGRWVELQSKFNVIPPGSDQDYEVWFVMTGGDEDDVYLNDLYTEIALIRYYMGFGGPGSSFQHEVTDLRYATNKAIVTVTEPTASTWPGYSTTMNISVDIHSPKAFAYKCRILPTYLK